jgi:myosin heavy subunit
MLLIVPILISRKFFFIEVLLLTNPSVQFATPSNFVNVNKQVFFRAGVLGQMEEFRDERLSRIMSWMQAWARGFLTRKTFKRLQEQRLALTVVQRALRRYLKLRTWPWWKLWQKVKPLLNASRVEDQIAVSSSTIITFRVRFIDQLTMYVFHASFQLLNKLFECYCDDEILLILFLNTRD